MGPTGCAPFKHAYVTYAPGQSHPPWDFRQANGEAPGGYGVAHIDVHFMVKTVAERESLTATCTTVPGATNSFGELIQCSDTATDAETLKFFNLPSPEETTGFGRDTTFGDHAVRGHGLHLIPLTDMQPGGPATCSSTGPFGTWADCQNQFLSVVFGGAFVDSNCTCGLWEDGTTAILNVYNGEVMGNEVMPTLDVVTMLQSGDLPNPYYEIYPQAQAYATPGYRPVQTMHELLASSGGDTAAPPFSEPRLWHSCSARSARCFRVSWSSWASR